MVEIKKVQPKPPEPTYSIEGLSWEELCMIVDALWDRKDYPKVKTLYAAINTAYSKAMLQKVN